MNEDAQTGHRYTDIELQDNPLPSWWKWLFVAMLLFCPVYWIFYHGGASGRSVEDAYAAELAANTRRQFAEIGDLEPTAETIVHYMEEDQWLRVGQSVFLTHCTACHGREGQGEIGPNLTDDYYKNASGIEDIARVISEGAAGGAMPKWSNRLHGNEIVLTAAYVASLRGTNVEGGRMPEGREIPPWPEPSEIPESEPDDATVEASRLDE